MDQNKILRGVPTAHASGRRILRHALATTCILAVSGIPAPAEAIENPSQQPGVAVAAQIAPLSAASPAKASVKVSLSDRNRSTEPVAPPTATKGLVSASRAPEVFKKPKFKVPQSENSPSASDTSVVRLASSNETESDSSKVVAVEPPDLQKAVVPTEVKPLVSKLPVPPPTLQTNAPKSSASPVQPSPSPNLAAIPAAPLTAPVTPAPMPTIEPKTSANVITGTIASAIPPSLERAATVDAKAPELTRVQTKGAVLEAPALMSPNSTTNLAAIDSATSAATIPLPDNQPSSELPVHVASLNSSQVIDNSMAPTLDSAPTLDPSTVQTETADLKIRRRKMTAQTYPKAIASIQSAKESVCKVFLIDAYNVAYLGTSDGDSKIRIQFADGSTGHHVVTVESSVSSSTQISDQQKLQTLSKTLKELYPKAIIDLAVNANGAVVVKGELASESDAKEVMLLVRQMFLVPIQDKLTVRPR